MRRVVVQAAGRMRAVLGDGRPSLARGEPRQFMSYAGSYTFGGTTLSTRVDASSDASRVGGDQTRTVRFENGLMVLAPPVVSLLAAWPFWRKGGMIFGNVVGTALIFGTSFSLIMREYGELHRATQALWVAGRAPVFPVPAAF